MSHYPIQNFTLELQGFPEFINTADPVATLEAEISARLAAGMSIKADVQLLRWAIVAVDRANPAGAFTCEGAYQMKTTAAP